MSPAAARGCEVRHHGGPAFRIKQDDLDRRGVVRYRARVTGAADGRPVLGDGTVCSMIEACQEIADFDRAARWTAVLTT
jgi:hypothetical protein